MDFRLRWYRPARQPDQTLFDRVDATSPAPELEARIVGIDLAESVTMARLDSEWKITNKVFHLHGQGHR